jgi:hypothetical protein
MTAPRLGFGDDPAVARCFALSVCAAGVALYWQPNVLAANQTESRRKDSNNRSRFATDSHASADDRLIGSVPARPELTTQNCRGLGTRHAIPLCECSPQHWLDANEIKEVGGNLGSFE